MGTPLMFVQLCMHVMTLQHAALHAATQELDVDTVRKHNAEVARSQSVASHRQSPKRALRHALMEERQVLDVTVPQRTLEDAASSVIVYLNYFTQHRVFRI